MEPKKGQLSNLCILCAYAYVKGVLTTVMSMQMLGPRTAESRCLPPQRGAPSIMSYKRSKLPRSALVRIFHASEYLLPPDLFL